MAASGVWLGTVTRVDAAGGVFLELPRLSADREHGPVPVIGGAVLVAGDRVAVGLLEGNPDRVIVLGRI